MAFHEVRFPTDISRDSQSAIERRTEVVLLGSGHEERNSRWADSRRSYNAGYGVKSIPDLERVVAFFEERRGRFHGFRWKDFSDFSTAQPGKAVEHDDQVIGVGDGEAATFELVKVYGGPHAPWTRRIHKPVAGSVRVSVDGTEVPVGSEVSVDTVLGTVTFQAWAVPVAGAVISAGFQFDVPVRFDTDKLEINLQGIHHGAMPNIPIIEVRV